MSKFYIGTGKELLAESLRVQSAFEVQGVYWSVNACMEQVIEQWEVNPNAKGTAKVLADSIDNGVDILSTLN